MENPGIAIAVSRSKNAPELTKYLGGISSGSVSAKSIGSKGSVFSQIDTVNPFGQSLGFLAQASSSLNHFASMRH